MKSRWSTHEIELLKKVYPDLTIKELMIAFPGRSQNSINGMVKRLKEQGEIDRDKTRYTIARSIRQRRPEGNPQNVKGDWTEERIQVLKVVYKYTTIKELLDIFPEKSVQSLQSKIGRLKRKGEIKGEKTEETQNRAMRQRTWSRQIGQGFYNVDPEEWRNR